MKESTHLLLTITILFLLFSSGCCNVQPTTEFRVSNQFLPEQQEDFIDAAQAWMNADPCVPELTIVITDQDEANVLPGTPQDPDLAAKTSRCLGVITISSRRIEKVKYKTSFFYVAMHELGHAINPIRSIKKEHIGKGNVMYKYVQDILKPTAADVDWVCNR